MAELNRRQKAAKIFNHEECEGVLKDFGGTVVSSIGSIAYARLRKHLKLEPKATKIAEHTMQIVEPHSDVAGIFNTDFARVAPNWTVPRIVDGLWTDEWGIARKKNPEHGFYDVISGPLGDLDKKKVDAFPWPSPEILPVDDSVINKARELYEDTDDVIVADFAAPGFFGSGFRMIGYEEFFVDMVSDPELTHYFMDRVIEHHKKTYERYLDKIGKYVQVVCFNDDYGMQDALFMAPGLFREYFKPALKALSDVVHQKSDAKMFLHSCGSVHEIIPDLIEAGIDILNPVQPLAKNMQPLKLKEEFGGKITLWGGIDEQGYMISATPEEIRENVINLVSGMKKGGGYVASLSHNVQEDVPLENLVAAFSAINEVK